jgi:hypothetical protein
MSMVYHDGMISTGRAPDLSFRALWQSYRHIHLVANQEELGEGNDEICLRNIFVHIFK